MEDIKKENRFLKNTIQLQKSVINSIPTEAKKTEEFEVKCHSLFSGMFTTTQINLILHPKKKCINGQKKTLPMPLLLGAFHQRLIDIYEVKKSILYRVGATINNIKK